MAAKNQGRSAEEKGTMGDCPDEGRQKPGTDG
jgi:hypothetical protein